jgi:hypothetical protein
MDGLKPLPLVVYKRDGGDRHAERPANEARDSIKAILKPRIEDLQTPQELEAFRFVYRFRSLHLTRLVE